METNWAAENLQTIRILMERTALYRRALAPINIFVGAVGILAAIGASVGRLGIEWFPLYWLAMGMVAVAGSLWLTRKQALKEGEIFWSPPLRRVAQAMFPPLAVGLVVGAICAVEAWFLLRTSDPRVHSWGMATVRYWIYLLPFIWSVLYGLALTSSGFFVSHNVRVFGWVFIMVGLVFPFIRSNLQPLILPVDSLGVFSSPDWAMGLIFGVLHVANGLHLYLTESRNKLA